MSNFVYDNLPLPESKSDRGDLPEGVPTSQAIRAADFNTVGTYLGDIRTAVNALTGVPAGTSPNLLPVVATGSTTGRFLGDRFADTVNVKDFGAKGDGVDDRAAVDLAFTAAASAGKPLYFPKGVYRINQLVLKTGMKVLGDGRYQTELRPWDSNLSVILIDRDAGATTGYAVEVASLRINGYDTGTGHGIEVTANNLGAVGMSLHDLRVEHVGGDGIHIESVWSSRLEDVWVDRVGGHGFYIRTSILGTTLTNCYARVVGSGKAGYRLVHGYLTLIGCNGIDSGDYWGIFGSAIAQGDAVNGTAHVSIIGCNVEDFANTGITTKNDSEIFVTGTSFLAPTTGTVRAVYFQNTSIGQTNLWGVGNTIVTKGAAWSNGFAVHFNYSPMIRIGKGSGDFVSGWYVTGGFGTSIPVLVQGEVNQGTLRVRGGLIISNDDSSGTPIKKYLSGTSTWDPPSVASGAFTSTTVTVTGAALGDSVHVGFTQAVPAGCILSGSVTATNTVTVTLKNDSGSPVDLASGTLRASVHQHY